MALERKPMTERRRAALSYLAAGIIVFAGLFGPTSPAVPRLTIITSNIIIFALAVICFLGAWLCWTVPDPKPEAEKPQ